MWHWLFLGPWLVFAAWWLVRARGTAPTASSESLGSRLSHALLLGGGAVLMAIPPSGLLARRLWRSSFAVAVAALALEVAGVAFAIWARETLGALWSGTITLKEGHRVVRTGPYRLARHPIYTGILTGVAGAALARGDVAFLAGVVLMTAGIARKIAIEERLLVAHFGDEYRAYRRDVRAIIPGIL